MMNSDDDLELARRILADCYGQSGELTPLARFNNPVFRVALPDGPRILKLAKSADGAATRKETMLIERLRGQGIPVAEVEHVDVTGKRVGRPFFTMRSAGEETVADLLDSGELAQALLHEMGAILARVHAIPADVFADLPADRISASGVAQYLESLAATAESLAQQRLLDKSEIARFRALAMPEASGESLCHSDYHAVQCVVRAGSIAAVVDWESAWIGNPTIDLAISHAYLDYYCSRELIHAFLDGYASVRAIPTDYGQAYLPVRMTQVLGMLRAWYTRGDAAWQAAIAQQKVARAVRLFRAYAGRLES